MAGNLISRPQLRSRRDQWRRRLAIFKEKKNCFRYLLESRALKNKSCKLMTKPRRYGGKSHPATPTQEQTRPISSETSNLYKTYAVFDVCCVNGHCRNKTLQTDDQTAQIWWKSHPGTPTQEQTRPISTETSTLDKEYAVSDICCVNGHCRNKTMQTDDQTAQIWWKISSWDANSGADEPMTTETSNLYK